MNFKNETSEILGLELKKNLFNVIFFLIISIGSSIAGFYAIASAKQKSLNCNRIGVKKIDCEFIETSLLKKEREEIKQVKYAFTISVTSKNNSITITYPNTILVGANKKINLCNCAKDFEINRFIKKSKSETLNLQFDDEKILFYFGIFILFSSAVTYYISLTFPIQCIFNRNTKRFYFKYLFSFRHNKEYLINEIKEVVTFENNGYHVSTIIMKTNRKFVLCMSQAKNEADSFTHSIKQFLV